MNRVLSVTLVVVFGLTGAAMAEEAGVSSFFKTVGKAAVDAGVQALNPQARAVVDQANTIKDPQAQENFLVAKAKEFLGSKNYDSALQVAQYVKTNVNARSLTADKIIADARAALADYAQGKVNQVTAPAQAQTNTTATQAAQVKADASKTASDVKNLLGSFGTKK